MPCILLVEDERSLARGIQFNLELDGYEVEVIHDGLEAAERLEALAGGSGPAPDLVILDVMLPGRDGFSIAAEMRRTGNFTPILMLTAKGLPEDVVNGLDAGADDYLPKPFDLKVLLARIRGLLRRRDWTRAGAVGERVRIGEAEVDFPNLEAFVRGESVQLTLLEASLLRLLYESAGRIVSKGEILEKVWNLSAATQTRAVDNFIVRLRRLVEKDPARPERLLTIRAAGYRLEP
jgi:DNA-binding response OmpR family regulator